MEEVMQKVSDLYGYLQLKSTEFAKRAEELACREKDVNASEKKLQVATAKLAVEAARVKNITDVEGEKQRVAEKSAELKLAAAELQAEKEKFAAYVKAKTNEITKLRQAADAETEDIRGTRARLMVEVKRVETERANMKQAILDELAGKI